MENNNFKIGQTVFVVKQFGTWKAGFDVQILDYKIGFLGKDSFLPEDYREYKNPEISYIDTFETLDDAFKYVVHRYGKVCDVSFELIRGQSYNVRLKDKKEGK